jgi:hypothetical protein
MRYWSTRTAVLHDLVPVKLYLQPQESLALVSLKTGPGRAEPVLHTVILVPCTMQLFCPLGKLMVQPRIPLSCYLGRGISFYGPEIVIADQCACFTADELVIVAAAHDIELRFTGIEAQNTIGIGDKHHGLFRGVFKKVTDEYFQAPTEMPRSCSYVSNTTIGTQGWSLELFGYDSSPQAHI